MEKMIFVNQKMYFNTIFDIQKFQEEMKDYNDKFVILPSYIYLDSYIDKGFIAGSQNISSEDSGDYTGEISGKSLSDLGAHYVMIGHYETRRQYKESYLNIQKRIDEATKNNLKIVLCVGEEKKDEVKEVIKHELESLDLPDDIIICYEPIWSIGTDVTPTNEEIEDIVNYIKEFKDVKVLYGGSVSPNNIENLNKISNINGFLVGSYAVQSSNLKKIIEVVLK